jgi:ribosomal protein S18 acetylase RimI-like enzyme
MIMARHGGRRSPAGCYLWHAQRKEAPLFDNPLDNPVWHALTGPHAAFALGGGLARHYPRDIAPFSAVAKPTAAAYADLAVNLPGSEARLFRPADEPNPPGWETLSAHPIIQMVAERMATAEPAANSEIVPLGIADATEMLALVEIAKPGPFGPNTVLLGSYWGVRREDRLVAMAGERLSLPGFVELSAICVHPDARGAGLGAALTAHAARRVSERGLTPFLHVYPDNPAKALYSRLGFSERARLWILWRRPVREAIVEPA